MLCNNYISDNLELMLPNFFLLLWMICWFCIVKIGLYKHIFFKYTSFRVRIDKWVKSKFCWINFAKILQAAFLYESVFAAFLYLHFGFFNLSVKDYRQGHTTNSICCFSFEKLESLTRSFTKEKKCCHIKRNSLQWAGGLQFANNCRHVPVRIGKKGNP